MLQLTRPLFPATAAALVLTTALSIWIRAGPLDMPRMLQVTLSTLLVAAVAGLIWRVARYERDVDRR